MKVTMNRVAAIALPAGMYSREGAANFVDGIALPHAADFRSAALVSGPRPTGPDADIPMGVVAFNKRSGQYEFAAAPEGSDSWPSARQFSAAFYASGKVQPSHPGDNLPSYILAYQVSVTDDSNTG